MDPLFIHPEVSGAMPPRKSKDKEVQPAQAEHADDSPVYSEGENDPVVPLLLSPFVEQSYGNLVFKERDAYCKDELAKSCNHDEVMRQCMVEWRWVFKEGTRVICETGEESRRTLQAVSEQVVEQGKDSMNQWRLLLLLQTMAINLSTGIFRQVGGEMWVLIINHAQGTFSGHKFLQPSRPALRPLVRLAYKKPYPDIIDHENPFPKGFKVPEFTLFSGENGLDIELQKKFEGMEFRDFYELSYKVAQYENLLKEDVQKKVASHGTYFDLDVAEVVIDKPVVCPDLVRPTHQPETSVRHYVDKVKETIGVNADPFPTVPVGVNVADLRSVARNRSLPYAQRKLVVEDLRWVIETQRSRHNKSVSAKGLKSEKGNRSKWRLRGSSSCRPRQPTKRNMVWVRKEKNGNVTQTLLEGDNQSPASPKVASVIEDMADKIVFEKPEEKMARHIRPLYINAHMDGTPINRVLLDNGAAVNVLPTCMLYKIGKSLDDLVHTEVTISDFTRGVNRSRGVLLVELTVGNRTLMSAFFMADTVATYNALLGRDWIHSNNKPFSANTHLVEARYYEEDIGTIRFFGMDRHGKPIGITACSRPSLSKRVVEEVSSTSETRKRKGRVGITKKLTAYFAEKAVQVDRSKIVHEGEEADQGDEITLEELDLAPAKLDDLKAEVQDPLEEINLGSENEPKVTFISGSLKPQTRDQIVKLLHEFKDCFAWDYSEMPSLDRKLVEHKLPIAEGFRRMSAEVTLKVKEEIERLAKAGSIRTCRLAVGCDAIWSEECWSYYQRDMNAIFHDMIGKFMEIYIDDVVVKSHGEEDHLIHLRKSFERMRQHGLKMNPLKCAFGVSASNFLGYLVHERGLEVDKNKAKAVIEAKPPQNKKELQRFFGQVNFLRRFIFNLAGKTRVFSPLLKLKSEADFKWEEHHQSAFDMIKRYLSRPPVFVSPAVKGQALADFLADHPCLEVEADEEKGINLLSISLVPWKLVFDGSSTETMSGAEVVVISPSGLKTQMSFQLDFNCTNNQAEYEALINGFEMLVELKVSMVEIIGDSQLVLKHVPRDQNYEANEMAQVASGEAMMNYYCVVWIRMKVFRCSLMSMMGFVVHTRLGSIVEKRSLPSIHQCGMTVSTCSIDDESFQMFSDVHDGICGAHQAGIKMGWLIRRHGFFWPSVLKDCIAYAKGCKSCQIHGPLQRVTASELNSIVKSWPFRGWAIDLIGKVYPPSSKGHSFIIVATDYFTKWLEAKPMKKVDQSNVIKFIKEGIVHRFGMPETITTDQGTVFVNHQVEAFAKEMGFRLLNFTPHYAQANGQAEASNKVVINLLEKMVDDNPDAGMNYFLKYYKHFASLLTKVAVSSATVLRAGSAFPIASDLTAKRLQKSMNIKGKRQKFAGSSLTSSSKVWIAMLICYGLGIGESEPMLSITDFPFPLRCDSLDMGRLVNFSNLAKISSSMASSILVGVEVTYLGSWKAGLKWSRCNGRCCFLGFRREINHLIWVDSLEILVSKPQGRMRASRLRWKFLDI
ncbi:hypothetical protein SLEP1_g27699 [Rubroshorea leprosula]|uniref:Integrase catalytic domain-containing protein n=1 Tax=Rubroshorea leprosula TaxID=152421 RepID=A0AAV5K0Y7_9ROSI|nr:hypothetical protein SLEP1_g27699 [Rubroshorea leprosula]